MCRHAIRQARQRRFVGLRTLHGTLNLRYHGVGSNRADPHLQRVGDVDAAAEQTLAGATRQRNTFTAQ